MITAEPNNISAATRCLKEIRSLPVDFDQPLFAHYPAMKMGHKSAVDFYVAPMAELAGKAMSARVNSKEWVITAPPYQALPAAANLLCWKVKKALEDGLSDEYVLTLLNLHYANAQLCANSERDFRLRYDYSRNSIEDRTKERHRLQDDIGLHKAVLSGRNILVINDIKVTGIQQDHMTRSFEQVKPAHVEWLYIFVVDRELGVKHPEIEHRINNSSLDSTQEYRRILCADETHHTARCISRLYNHDLDDFKALIDALEPARRRHLCDLVEAEQRFDGEYFAEKTAFLKNRSC